MKGIQMVKPCCRNLNKFLILGKNPALPQPISGKQTSETITESKYVKI